MKHLTSYLLFSFFALLIDGCAIGKASCPSCSLKLIPLNGIEYSRSQLIDFFCTIQPDCLKLQVEFSETANEEIFHVLHEKPEMFVEVFDGLNRKKKALILSMIENPINDEVNLNELLEMMYKIPNHKNSVNKICFAIGKAISKY
jgi:hypothetical protein